MERRFWRSRRQEIGPGIKDLITVVFPQRAVKFIRAGLGNHVDHAAQNRAELRAVGVGNDFKLLDRIDNGRYGVGTVIYFVTIQTIGHVVVAAVGCSVDDGQDEGRAYDIGTQASTGILPRIGGGYSWCQRE